MSLQITPELVTSIATLVGAIGVAIKNARDNRRERRARRRELLELARAASKGKAHVDELVDECERTGEFRRPSGFAASGRSRARARAREPGPSDT